MNLECHGQRSPVNVAIPPIAPSGEDIMYQGPGGCIVGKYNVTNKVCLQSRFSAIVWNAQSREPAVAYLGGFLVARTPPPLGNNITWKFDVGLH